MFKNLMQKLKPATKVGGTKVLPELSGLSQAISDLEECYSSIIRTDIYSNNKEDLKHYLDNYSASYIVDTLEATNVMLAHSPQIILHSPAINSIISKLTVATKSFIDLRGDEDVPKNVKSQQLERLETVIYNIVTKLIDINTSNEKFYKNDYDAKISYLEKSFDTQGSPQEECKKMDDFVDTNGYRRSNGVIQYFYNGLEKGTISFDWVKKALYNAPTKESLEASISYIQVNSMVSSESYSIKLKQGDYDELVNF